MVGFVERWYFLDQNKKLLFNSRGTKRKSIGIPFLILRNSDSRCNRCTTKQSQLIFYSKVFNPNFALNIRKSNIKNTMILVIKLFNSL